jgi:hypothetical protein
VPDRAWHRTNGSSQWAGRSNFGFSILDFGFRGTKVRAPVVDGRRLHRQICQSGSCLTELGVSGQRRLSVGGAMTRFRSRLHQRRPSAPANCSGIAPFRDSNWHPQSGSRMRRHRWLQANGSPTPVTGYPRAGAQRSPPTDVRSAQERASATKSHAIRAWPNDTVLAGWGKSPDAPEFFPSPSIATSTQIPIEIFFSLSQHLRRDEVATKDF